jgi:hypothetical protein
MVLTAIYASVGDGFFVFNFSSQIVRNSTPFNSSADIPYVTNRNFEFLCKDACALLRQKYPNRGLFVQCEIQKLAAIPFTAFFLT